MNILTRIFFVMLLTLQVAWAEPLDINSATAEQLSSTIVGVGKAKAEAIIKNREANGPFKSVEDLERVPGIGKIIITKNKDKLTVGASAVPAAPAAPAALAAPVLAPKK